MATLLRIPEGHSGRVVCVEVSPDDSTVRVRGVATGECAQTLGHTRFSPAGAKLVSASTDETARSRDVAMGGCQHTGGRQQTQEGHTDTATTSDCTKLPSRRLPAAGGVRRAGLGAGRSASRRCPPPAARAPSRHDRTLGLKSIGNSSLEIVNLDWDSLPIGIPYLLLYE